MYYTGEYREGTSNSRTAKTPAQPTEERVISGSLEDTEHNSRYKEKVTCEKFKHLSSCFSENGISYPFDFIEFMQVLADKSVKHFNSTDESLADHYHLRQWISSKRVRSIYDLLAAHTNSSLYSTIDVTENMVRALSKAADDVLNDVNLRNNCRYTKTEIVTMLMLSMIRCHCAVLYFTDLVDDMTKAPNPWRKLTIKMMSKTVNVGAGRRECRTVYEHVISK